VASLEMSADELFTRVVANVARIDSQRLKSGVLTDSDWQKVAGARQRLAGAPLLIDADAASSVAALRARARRVRSKHKDLGLIVVDYLQLLSAPAGKSENRQLEVAENARLLKLLARDLNVPVIALSQVNRAVEQRADKRPTLADLRESGAIEAHADVVAALYRDEVYDPATADRAVAELHLLKHRTGPIGMIKLVFLGSQGVRFASPASP
jgi:replicative DNA helicase